MGRPAIGSLILCGKAPAGVAIFAYAAPAPTALAALLRRSRAPDLRSRTSGNAPRSHLPPDLGPSAPRGRTVPAALASQTFVCVPPPAYDYLCNTPGPPIRPCLLWKCLRGWSQQCWVTRERCQDFLNKPPSGRMLGSSAVFAASNTMSATAPGRSARKGEQTYAVS
jgi:hypothetical protein